MNHMARLLLGLNGTFSQSPAYQGGGLLNSFMGKRRRRQVTDSRSRLLAWGLDRQEKTELTAVDLALRFKSDGLRRILYTDIERDGMFTGPNIEQTRNLARQTSLAVTASGGVSSLEDLRRLSDLIEFGVDSVVVGKAFYESKILPEDVFSAG